MQTIAGLKLFGRGPLPHPPYLIFFVTSQCVGRCRHCFYWEHLNQPEDRLRLDEIEKIASSLRPMLQVTFTGGEPFLREDFMEIVEIFYRRSKVYHLGIATSGYFPERIAAEVEQFLRRWPEARLTVGVPLEGPPELNDEIRGLAGFYERTTETLRRLKELKFSWPRLTTLIDITASGFNRGHLVETYELARDQLCPDSVNLILTRGHPREEEALSLDPAEVQALLEKMEADIRAGRLGGYSFFPRLLHAKDIVLRQKALEIYRGGSCDLPCEAGRVAGVLMPDGRVYPCELWPQAVGNVREADLSFPRIWTSEAVQKARAQILQSRCTCYHQCFLSPTLFFNRRAWPQIMASWRRLRSGAGLRR